MKYKLVKIKNEEIIINGRSPQASKSMREDIFQTFKAFGYEGTQKRALELAEKHQASFRDIMSHLEWMLDNMMHTPDDHAI